MRYLVIAALAILAILIDLGSMRIFTIGGYVAPSVVIVLAAYFAFYRSGVNTIIFALTAGLIADSFSAVPFFVATTALFLIAWGLITVAGLFAKPTLTAVLLASAAASFAFYLIKLMPLISGLRSEQIWPLTAAILAGSIANTVIGLLLYTVLPKFFEFFSFYEEQVKLPGKTL